jgi:hypothetical protein
MKVKNKNVYDTIQLTHDNYDEFRKYLEEEKFWNVSPLHARVSKVWCYIADTVEPAYVHEGDYVIFKDLSIIEIINENKFNEKYEIVPDEPNRCSIRSEVVQNLITAGIATVVDGYSDSKKNLLELLQKESLTDDEKADFVFHSNVFISCF